MGKNNRTVKKNVARADKVIQGVKRGGEIVATAGGVAIVFVKANGPEMIKQAPNVAKKVITVAKTII